MFGCFEANSPPAGGERLSVLFFEAGPNWRIILYKEDLLRAGKRKKKSKKEQKYFCANFFEGFENCSSGLGLKGCARPDCNKPQLSPLLSPSLYSSFT